SAPAARRPRSATWTPRRRAGTDFRRCIERSSGHPLLLCLSSRRTVVFPRSQADSRFGGGEGIHSEFSGLEGDLIRTIQVPSMLPSVGHPFRQRRLFNGPSEPCCPRHHVVSHRLAVHASLDDAREIPRLWEDTVALRPAIAGEGEQPGFPLI